AHSIECGAQRLPASQEQSRIPITRAGKSLCCAQRLPASQEQSPVEGKSANHDLRCSTPSGITGTITFSSEQELHQMIGAQRLPASQEQSLWILTDSVQGSMCSTPSGITGTITIDILEIGDKLVVLNAFRHHRNNHLLPSLEGFHRPRC